MDRSSSCHPAVEPSCQKDHAGTLTTESISLSIPPLVQHYSRINQENTEGQGARALVGLPNGPSMRGVPAYMLWTKVNLNAATTVIERFSTTRSRFIGLSICLNVLQASNSVIPPSPSLKCMGSAITKL